MTSEEEDSANWQLWIALGFIALGIAVIVRMVFPPTSPSIHEDRIDRENKPEPIVGAFAPDVNLLNLDQEKIQLRDFIGKPVMLNFWATWCEPCRVEMPAIQDRYEKFSEEGLVVLAINAAEPQKDVETFKNELDLTFDLLLDPVADTQRLYRIQGYPTSVFIGSDGIIQAIHFGILSKARLDHYLSQIGLSPDE